MPIARVAATMATQKKHAKRSGPKKGSKDKKLTKAELLRARARRENIGCCGSKAYSDLAYKCREIRDATWFQTSLIGVIVLAGIQVGVQTYPIPEGAFATTLLIADNIILAIFILEIVIKLIAEGNSPHLFFTDGWNNFDFAIVVVGVMPFGGNAVTALRLVRLLRVLKLVKALPKLRILVLGLLLSMSSIAYIGMLLMLLFYLFAVVGISIFGANDPIHFGSLHIALITLFRCSTLEDWTDVMYINMFGCDQYGYGDMEENCVNPAPNNLISIIYFCTFVTLSSMMILNLFIGVITGSMAEAKTNLSAEAADEEPDPDFSLIPDRMAALEQDVQTIVREMQEVLDEKINSQSLVPAEVGLSVGSPLASKGETKEQPEDTERLFTRSTRHLEVECQPETKEHSVWSQRSTRVTPSASRDSRVQELEPLVTDQR